MDTFENSEAKAELISHVQNGSSGRINEENSVIEIKSTSSSDSSISFLQETSNENIDDSYHQKNVNEVDNPTLECSLEEAKHKLFNEIISSLKSSKFKRRSSKKKEIKKFMEDIFGMSSINSAVISENIRKNTIENFKAHCILLQVLVTHEVENTGNQFWSNDFSPIAQKIISLNVNHRKIKETNMVYANWIANVEVHCLHPLKLCIFLNTLDKLIYHHSNSNTPNKNKLKIPEKLKITTASKTVRVFTFGFARGIKKGTIENDDDILKLFWKSANKLFDTFESSIHAIHEEIETEKCQENKKVLKEILEIASRLDQFFIEHKIEEAIFKKRVSELLRHGANEFLINQINKNSIISADVCAKLAELIRILELARKHTAKLKEICAIDISAEEVAYAEFNKQICEIVKPIVLDIADVNNLTKHNDDNVLVKIFELHGKLAKFSKYGIKFTSDLQYEIHNFHEWYRAGTATWRSMKYARNIKRIEKAIEKDNLEPEHEGTNFSSSAIDTMQILFSSKNFWVELFMDEIKESNLFETILNDFCELTKLYITKFYTKIEAKLGGSNVEELILPSEVMIALGNFKYVEQNFKEMIKSFDDENNSDESKVAMCIEKFQKIIDDKIDLLLKFMVNKLHEPLKLIIKKASKEIFKIFNILMQPLTNMLNTLSENLAEERLQQVKINIFGDCLTILSKLIQRSIDKNKSTDTFINISEIFENLKILFSEVAPNPEIHDQTCKIELQLKCYQSEKSNLIKKYFNDRFEFLTNNKIPQHGSLMINCFLIDNVCKLKVIKANLESPHTFDSFIKIYAIPNGNMQKVQKFKTKVQQSTLNPKYDEAFEIRISDTEVLARDTILFFKIMEKSPGKKDEYFAETFFMCKQIEDQEEILLSLTKSPTEGLESLSIIKQRSEDGDKDAKDFLKKINTSF